MNGNQIGALIYLITFLATGWTMENAPVPARIAMVVVLGVMTFFALTENPIKGLWIGRTKEAMEDEIEAIAQLMQNWQYPDGSTVPMEKRQKLMNRQRSLYHKVGSYREAHQKRPYE